MKKWMYWILTGLILCSTPGCTQKTGNSVPEDAMFCDNLAERVQEEQLHVETATGITEFSPSDSAPVYAMWFPVMEYADTLQGKSQDEFRQAMRKRFQKTADLGINTVYLHVRAYQDAYYPSERFPWGSYADADIDFDPLAVLLEEAHAQNLSAHAWINPLRCPTDKAMQEMNDQYTIKQWYNSPEKNGTYLVQVENNWWLNPAYPEVRQFIADGAAEIAERYPVDGIHIDDYFYPTTDSSFDLAAFSESGGTDLTAFRLEQTNAMVQAIYQAVKKADAAMQFSISPQGTMQGNYAHQYADVKRWASEPGFCDVLIPQIYYGFENETAPFIDTVSAWTEAVTAESVSLVVGIGTHKMGKEDTWAGSGCHEWQEHSDIPQRQVEYLLQCKDVSGIAIYDYDTTFAPETAAEAMAQQVQAIQALLRPQPDGIR